MNGSITSSVTDEDSLSDSEGDMPDDDNVGHKEVQPKALQPKVAEAQLIPPLTEPTGTFEQPHVIETEAHVHLFWYPFPDREFSAIVCHIQERESTNGSARLKMDL